MTFQKSLDAIRAKLEKFGDVLDNEEITKDVLIRPMIQALGYDSSDPTQVKAEYSVTLSKGGRGRADYVIMHNGEPAIVMECKALGVQLDQRIQNQMLQYARALGAFAGIVTDGDTYLCFANVEDQNRIDGRWYHALALSEPNDQDEQALALLAKEQFFQSQLRTSAESFVANLDQRDRLFDILEDPVMTEVILRLGGIADTAQREEELNSTLESLQEMIREMVGRIARGELELPDVFTTNDEWNAFQLCKGMLYGAIEPHRVEFRDSKTYASVLIDDNNRKPLCRFHFNGRIKHLGTFDADKQETRHTIEDVDDLLKFARTLRKTAKQYAES